MRDQLDVPCEFKLTSDEGVFEGYASVFGVIDSYADIIAAGAFKRTLREHQQKKRLPSMLFQHDVDRPIGVYEAMREDEKGLFVHGRLALKTQAGAETYELLRMGALTGLSIGFKTRNSKIDKDSGIRTLTDVDLFEVSPVVFPANDSARVTAIKSDELPSERVIERWLRREVGLSDTQAKTVIARGYRQVRREAGLDEDRGAQLLESLARLEGTLIGASHG